MIRVIVIVMMIITMIINIRAGGLSAPLYDVNVNKTLRRAWFCALQHIQTASREKATQSAKPCVFGHLSGVSPEEVPVHGMPGP